MRIAGIGGLIDKYVYEYGKLARFGRTKRATLPMHDIMWFAVHSARREGEITRLLWEDNEERELTGLVRDRKHPRAKEGNHRCFKYTREAWKIVQRQPRTSPDA